MKTRAVIKPTKFIPGLLLELRGKRCFLFPEMTFWERWKISTARDWIQVKPTQTETEPGMQRVRLGWVDPSQCWQRLTSKTKPELVHDLCQLCFLRPIGRNSYCCRNSHAELGSCDSWSSLSAISFFHQVSVCHQIWLSCLWGTFYHNDGQISGHYSRIIQFSFFILIVWELWREELIKDDELNCNFHT